MQIGLPIGVAACYVTLSGQQQWGHSLGMMTKLLAGPIPLYHQLEQDIAARIASGEFAAGEMLPTEEKLGQSYGVSRITVRKALDTLERQVLITRRRGIGSFVVDRKPGIHAVHLSGSLDDFLQTAQRLTPRVLALEACPAPTSIADAFGIEPDANMLRLELVSSTEDGPLAHGEFFFPERMIGILTLEDIRTSEPIVRTLERLTGAKVVRAEQLIEPDVASDLTAELLGIASGSPLLRTQRTYFTSEGEPIEIATLRYHPKRYRYQVELRTRPYVV